MRHFLGSGEGGLYEALSIDNYRSYFPDDFGVWFGRRRFRDHGSLPG